MADTILTSKPMRDARTLTRPVFSMPENACDSHVHVFESAAQYPSVEAPHYTLPDGALTKLRQMTEVLALRRFVIVQPSYYGTDNRCMLDALSAAGSRARGVAMVGENCTDEEMNAMHVRGATRRGRPRERPLYASGSLCGRTSRCQSWCSSSISAIAASIAVLSASTSLAEPAAPRAARMRPIAS
jgi:hypothetical protein